MLNLAKLKHDKATSPYKLPVKAEIVGRLDTTNQGKDGSEKKIITLGLADDTAAIKAICYDYSKSSQLREKSQIMIRNYIYRDGTIIMTSTTKVFQTGGIPAIPNQHKEEAKLIASPPRPPPVQPIATAKKESVDTLVTLQGKIIKIDDVSSRIIKRTQETVPYRSITIKDSSDSVQIGLWRQQAEKQLRAGSTIQLTHMRLNLYKTEISFNSIAKTEITEIEDPVEVIRVTVEGYYPTETGVTMVCQVEDTDIFEDFTMNEEFIQTAFPPSDVQTSIEIFSDEIPFRALIGTQNKTCVRFEKL